MRGEREVALFGRAQLRELQANDYKGGWDGLGRSRHFMELDYHLAKLKAAARAGDRLRVLEFAADVANHAMFFAQAEGVLDEKTLCRREQEPSFVRPLLGVYRRLMWNPRWFKKGIAGWRQRNYEQHEEPELTTELKETA